MINDEREHNWLSRRRDQVKSRLLDGIDWLSGWESTPEGVQAEDRDHPAVGLLIVGCGFVADFYASAIAKHSSLDIVGAFDLDRMRTERFVQLYGGAAFESLEAALMDPRVEIVVNLTNPYSHFVVSEKSLDAGKHVYSEKPLAMDFGDAEALVQRAQSRNLMLSAAPCSVLSQTAKALRETVLSGEIGEIRLVYAELDDGPIHLMQPEEWCSPAGTPWPWRDEYAVGCTLEHSTYHLTWLVDLLGPASSVTAFASCQIPNKHATLPSGWCGPDFSVAVIEFESGVVARLTCSIVAPHDHALRIIGDRGTAWVDECWHFDAPVRVRRFDALTLRAETYTWLGRHAFTRWLFSLDGRIHPSSVNAGLRRYTKRHDMDYALGLTDLAQALRQGRPPRLSAALALHVTEIALAIHNSRGGSTPVLIRSGLNA